MGKTKKGIADRVRKAKNAKTKNVFKVQNNPFEVKINKQKHNILGRKTKHDRGLPGVSRSKANKKRKDTLLKEYKERYKTNNVVDERFGEESTEMSVEEKMLQRFAMEKKRKHENMSMFNLNDEEELTHFGQSLSSIDNFDINADSDEEDTGVISGEYVSEAHFGGGIFTKKSTDDQPEDEKPKSRKEIIDEIILKSKKAKFEKQTAQEETNDLREKLDNTWQEVEKLLKSSSRTPKDKEVAKYSYKPDEYDVAVKQMQFDKKAAPSARGKTEAEQAAEEAMRIRKMEDERIQRMQEDYDNTTKKLAHRSADDLNYDFLPEKVYVDPVQYKDGVMVGSGDQVKMEDDVDNWQLDPIIPEHSDDDEEEAGNQDEESSDGEDDADQNSSDQEEEDAFSDIVTDDEDDMGKDQSSDDDVNSDSGVLSLDKESGIAEAKEKGKFPGSYKEFCTTVETKYSGNCEKCVASLRNQFPTGFAEGNKDKLRKLFQYVWQSIYDLCSKDEVRITELNKLIRPLYELCQINPVPCAKFVVEAMRKAHKKHLLKNGKLAMPSLAHLIQFKLIKSLFSTSDFIHPVCTPAMVFMSHIVYSCRPSNVKDLSSCLFLCTLIYEYVCFSKRFVPEVINLLCAAVCFATPKAIQQSKGIPSSASLYLNSRNCELLVRKGTGDSEITSQTGQIPDLLKLLANKTDKSHCSDAVRIQLIRTTLRLILKFAILYGQMPCFEEIFDPIRISCARCLTSYFKDGEGNKHPLEELLNEVQNEIQRLTNKRPTLTPLVQTASNKPKALPLYDPKIEEGGEPFQKGSRKKTSATKRERDRLQHKYKRELKGAVREIKKDARFLAREQLNEQIEKDKERAAKVKRLFGFLSNQEGEVKKINRKKFRLELS